MRDINQVAITGRVATDPELRATSSGTQVLTFRVAVNERARSADGNWEDRASFVGCVCFGRQCDWLSRELAKGTPIAGSGRLHQTTWEQNGERRSRLEVILEDVRRLAAREAPAASQAQEAVPTGAPDVYDDDIPF